MRKKLLFFSSKAPLLKAFSFNGDGMFLNIHHILGAGALDIVIDCGLSFQGIFRVKS